MVRPSHCTWYTTRRDALTMRMGHSPRFSNWKSYCVSPYYPGLVLDFLPLQSLLPDPLGLCELSCWRWHISILDFSFCGTNTNSLSFRPQIRFRRQRRFCPNLSQGLEMEYLRLQGTSHCAYLVIIFIGRDFHATIVIQQFSTKLRCQRRFDS